jgi:hypothetical protein
MSHRRRSEPIIGAALVLAVLLVGFTPIWRTGQASAAMARRGTATSATYRSPCTLSSSPLRASGPPSPGFPVATAPPGPPTGLIAAQAYAPGQPMFTPSRMVFGNRAIAGVQVIATWEDLEPHLGTFNWAPVDHVFAEADASHKFVVLTLVPGFGAPGWALAAPVEWACFDRQYGAGAHQPAPLAVPWDATYLASWYTFLAAVNTRYGTNPEFRMVSAGGPTSVSDETSLPNASGKTKKDKALPPADRGSDLTAWEALGYTPERYEVAWQAVFGIYAHLFTRQYVSLALYPGLQIANGAGDDAKTEDIRTPTSILTDGIAETKPGRFAAQENGLTASGQGGKVFTLVESHHGTIVTGFQLTTSATTNPAVEAGPGYPAAERTDPLDVLTSALNRGLQAQADFLEVYEPDVVNPALQCELQKVGTHWRAGPTPACPPLGSPKPPPPHCHGSECT